jgi:hypothetical protein
MPKIEHVATYSTSGPAFLVLLLLLGYGQCTISYMLQLRKRWSIELGLETEGSYVLGAPRPPSASTTAGPLTGRSGDPSFLISFLVDRVFRVRSLHAKFLGFRDLFPSPLQ